MDIAEAEAVNVVLSYLLGLPPTPGPLDAADSEEARHFKAGDAASYLADRAHSVLGKGIAGPEVGLEWVWLVLARHLSPDQSSAPTAESPEQVSL